MPLLWLVGGIFLGGAVLMGEACLIPPADPSCRPCSSEVRCGEGYECIQGFCLPTERKEETLCPPEEADASDS
jgi:hypothetical protein